MSNCSRDKEYTLCMLNWVRRFLEIYWGQRDDKCDIIVSLSTWKCSSFSKPLLEHQYFFAVVFNSTMLMVAEYRICRYVKHFLVEIPDLYQNRSKNNTIT
jgi:hypothetical protein